MQSQAKKTYPLVEGVAVQARSVNRWCRVVIRELLTLSLLLLTQVGVLLVTGVVVTPF